MHEQRSYDIFGKIQNIKKSFKNISIYHQKSLELPFIFKKKHAYHSKTTYKLNEGYTEQSTVYNIQKCLFFKTNYTRATLVTRAARTTKREGKKGNDLK